jgi:serine/threonine-protein kinase HipA
MAGIRVPDWTLDLIDDKAVLIVDRFDRAGDRRIGYVSAMTMLEAIDGDQGSYLDMADVIERHSPQANQDLGELWRRIAFSILISNTDDHLRNHGFLRTSSAGWTLSPTFDLNPDPSPGPKHLSTAIDFDDTTASLETLTDVAGYFRLNDDDARRVLGEVSDATSQWRTVAQKTGLDHAAIRQMTPAFEHDQANRARQITAA